ncbi:Hypothetical protein D9617_20g027980 [Elsinoe fawcettii]|nr:Hypothetical protein D9617_20g027980 [Elsinoe fawcettii]
MSFNPYISYGASQLYPTTPHVQRHAHFNYSTSTDLSNHNHYHSHRSKTKEKYYLIRRRRTTHSRPSYDLIRTSNPRYAQTQHPAQAQQPDFPPPLAYMQTPSPFQQQLMPAMHQAQPGPYAHSLCPQHASYPSTPNTGAATHGSTYGSPYTSPHPTQHSSPYSSSFPAHGNIHSSDGRELSSRATQNQQTRVELNFPSTSSMDLHPRKEPRFMRLHDLAGDEEDGEMERLKRDLDAVDLDRRDEEVGHRSRSARQRDGERNRLEKERFERLNRLERLERLRRDESDRARENERYRLGCGRRYSVVVPDRSDVGYGRRGWY